MKVHTSQLGDSKAEPIHTTLKAHRRLKRWQKVVSALALVVLIGSGYAMMRPAITMDKTNFYGQNSETEQAAEKPDSSLPAQINEPPASDMAKREGILSAKAAPQDQSWRVDKLELSKNEAFNGDEIALKVGFSWKKDDVKAGDYIIITWPETGTARLDLTEYPTEVKYRNFATVIATTTWEPGKLTITFNEAVEGVGLPERWAIVDMKFTAHIDQSHPESFAALTISGGALSGTVTLEKTGGYSVYEESTGRKVDDPNGNLDAEWSLCLNHDKMSPGTPTGPSGGYLKIVNPTEAQYMEFAGDDTPGRYQRVKRILYAKAALYPDYDYGVFQNELWLAVTGLASYDIPYGGELAIQKQAIRAVADSNAYDEDIENRLEVVIYKSNDGRLQNTITANLKELPPPPPADTASLTIQKQVSGTGGEQDRDFHFTLSLFQPRQAGTTAVYPLTGTYNAIRNNVPETITFDETGKATFTLKHDESLTITGIEKGFYYQLEEVEANADGYTTTVQRPDADSQLDSQSGFNNFDSCDGVAEEVSIVFTNDRPASTYQAEVHAHKTIDGELP